MKTGTIFTARGRLRRQGTRTAECSECGSEYTKTFHDTIRINQRVIAADADEARYLVEQQHDVDTQSGIDDWLEPLTIEPLPPDQVLRELGARELFPTRALHPELVEGAMPVPARGHL